MNYEKEIAKAKSQALQERKEKELLLAENQKLGSLVKILDNHKSKIQQIHEAHS